MITKSTRLEHDRRKVGSISVKVMATKPLKLTLLQSLANFMVFGQALNGTGFIYFSDVLISYLNRSVCFEQHAFVQEKR